MLNGSRRAVMSLLVLATLGIASTSCGDQGTEDPSSNRQVPITDRALAAVAAEHLGRPERAQIEQDPYGLKHPIAAAHVRYPVPSEDGDLVTVRVGTGLDPRLDKACRPKHLRGGCFTVDGVQVTWWEEIPEEDPGSVGIIAHREDGVLVLVSYSGSSITGDPRKQDLSVSMDGLIALARDARINRTTSQAVVEAGEKLDYWTFG
jgi:hypothetical protein